VPDTFLSLVPVVWERASSMLTENSGSGGRKQLADTPFDPVSAIQGLQEVHGKHLFVRGAGVVGQIVMTDYQHRP